jgi:L,D-transpeptidase YcbB
MKIISPIVILISFSILMTSELPVQNWRVTTGNVSVTLDSLVLTKEDLFAPAEVRAFYKERNYELAWIADGIPLNTVDSMINVLRDTRILGLIPNEYHISTIAEIFERPLSPARAIKLDIMLTDAFLKLTYHLRHGRIDPATGNVLLKNHRVDTLRLFLLKESIYRNNLHTAVLASEPGNIEYQELKNLLREKLLLLENGMTSSEDRVFLKAELFKIAINLERWRQDSFVYPTRYLLVNIPSYTAVLRDAGAANFKSRVIVGLPDKQTPELTSNITCIVFYPYWHVPRSIATKELLPSIKKDPSYLERNNFEVLDTRGVRVEPKRIDWKQYSLNHFPFTLRQREGDDNALGVIKFYFDNPYGVYLHDTNARHLFSKDVRALSHGCIRLEKARDLAAFLMQNESYAHTLSIDNIIASKRRKDFSIHNALPIVVRYHTADGVGVYKDVYKRDSTLLSAFHTFLEESAEYSNETYFIRYANAVWPKVHPKNNSSFATLTLHEHATEDYRENNAAQ